MAYFALLWKARAIEKYRIKYENEKMKSIMLAKAELPKESLFKRWCHCHYNCKKRMTKMLRRWFPEGSPISNFLIYLRTDQTFPNFVLKSILGFVGGIVMTYLCFMFFVFQLSISLIHATIMSSIIGVMLTLGLAFSYRARCLVFLLIPQFFSRVGRYTLTCYALVLILTGPATNTLKNSEVLSESMACNQEQLKTSVREITESAKKPFNSMKETIKVMINRVRQVTANLKGTLLKIHRLALSIVSVLDSSFSWLNSVVHVCNKKLGTPYERCNKAIEDGNKMCKAKFGPMFYGVCNVTQIGAAVCETFRPLKAICVVIEFVKGTLVVTVQKKLQTFANHIKTMLFVAIHVHHSFSFSSNNSRSASQVAAGIVTEIRSRADPLLTWLSWSSCVTSLFLLLIIFRAKYYQHMYETRSRFDNRYVTKDLRDLDLKRMRQGRETVLPLNRREKAKYVTTTSFRLVAFEKLYMTRSAWFMMITTLKLLIHMVADYSLYWVLMTIRYHGRFQSPRTVGAPNAGVQVTGQGPVASIIRAIIGALAIPIASPEPSVSCLPNPYPPDVQRYAQIGVLIFLHWFFAIFEPFGLRLRHVIMGLYRPERAKSRAVWLYNHILRMRGSFLKFARRKLHRQYKYYNQEQNTFRHWVETNIPCSSLRYLLGIRRKDPACMLCGTTEFLNDSDTQLTRCETPECPGIYCTCCFNDIGQLCTICLSPSDYGDLSDVSLEKGSSDDSDHSDCDDSEQLRSFKRTASLDADDSDSSIPRHSKKKTNRSKSFKKKKTKGNTQEDLDPLLEDDEQSDNDHRQRTNIVCYRMDREDEMNIFNKSVTENEYIQQNENIAVAHGPKKYLNEDVYGDSHKEIFRSKKFMNNHRNVQPEEKLKLLLKAESLKIAPEEQFSCTKKTSLNDNLFNSDTFLVDESNENRHTTKEYYTLSGSKPQNKKIHKHKSGLIVNKKNKRIRYYNFNTRKILPRRSETFFGKFAKYCKKGVNPTTSVSLWPLKCRSFGHLKFYKIKKTSRGIHVTKFQRSSKLLRNIRINMIRLKRRNKVKHYKRVPKNKIELNGIPKHVKFNNDRNVGVIKSKNDIKEIEEPIRDQCGHKINSSSALWSRYRCLKYLIEPIHNLLYLDDSTTTEESNTKKPNYTCPKNIQVNRVKNKLGIGSNLKETKILIDDVLDEREDRMENHENAEPKGSKTSLFSLRKYCSSILDRNRKVKTPTQVKDQYDLGILKDAEVEAAVETCTCAIQPRLPHANQEAATKIKPCTCASHPTRSLVYANAKVGDKTELCSCAVQPSFKATTNAGTEPKTRTRGIQHKQVHATNADADTDVNIKTCTRGVQPNRAHATNAKTEANIKTRTCRIQFKEAKSAVGTKKNICSCATQPTQIFATDVETEANIKTSTRGIQSKLSKSAVLTKKNTCSCSTQPTQKFTKSRSTEAKYLTKSFATQYSGNDEGAGDKKSLYGEKYLTTMSTNTSHDKDSLEYVDEVVNNVTDYTESTVENLSTDSMSTGCEGTQTASSSENITRHTKDWWSPLTKKKYESGWKLKSRLQSQNAKIDVSLLSPASLKSLLNQQRRMKGYNYNLQNYMKKMYDCSNEISQHELNVSETKIDEIPIKLLSDYAVLTEVNKMEQSKNDFERESGNVGKIDQIKDIKKKNIAIPNKAPMVTFKSIDEIIPYDSARCKNESKHYQEYQRAKRNRLNQHKQRRKTKSIEETASTSN